MMETVGDTMDLMPEIRDELKRMFDIFGDLNAILAYPEANLWYHKLMLRVIAARELKEGNYTSDIWTYKLNKSFDEIVKTYGGTPVLPLTDKL